MKRLNADEGLTLVELVVTVAILGIAFLSIVGGMTAAVLASDIHRKEASAGAVLRSYAEALVRDDGVVGSSAWKSCAAISDYGVTVWKPSSDYTMSITQIRYWRSSDNSWQTTCSTAGHDAELQLLSLRVLTSDGRATETTQVIKRKP